MKIEELFIPYELALEVKKLEFEWPCLKMFSQTIEKKFDDFRSGDEITFEGEMIHLSIYNHGVILCMAPTWDQIFDWFRKKHELECIIYPTYGVSQTYYCMVDRKIIEDEELQVLKVVGVSNHKLFNTYREAQIACLQQLIKIVKEKSI